MRYLVLLASLGLAVIALTSCGGGGEEPAPTTTAEGETPVAQTSVAAVGTPVATVESEYDEAWAREQVEPYLKEVYEIVTAQEWNKAYDLESTGARAGCSRSTYVSKMAGVWLLAVAFGADEIMKAQMQDLKEGKLAIAFSEITPERITYTVGDDEPTTIVREKGKWLTADPLGEDCASLDMDSGEENVTPTEGAGSDTTSVDTYNACVAKWDTLTDPWNDMTQAERDSYQQDDDLTGFDEYLAAQGYPGIEWPGFDQFVAKYCPGVEP